MVDASRLRIAGSILCIVAYALVTQGYVVSGTGLNLVTNVLFTPYMLSAGMWDMVAIEVFYLVLNVLALWRFL